MNFPLSLFLAGLIMLATILGIFWLKDQMRSPLLARLAYSGLVARLAVIAAVFVILGLLLIISNLYNK